MNSIKVLAFVSLLSFPLNANLNQAVRELDPGAVALALGKGEDPSTPDETGKTALDIINNIAIDKKKSAEIHSIAMKMKNNELSDEDIKNMSPIANIWFQLQLYDNLKSKASHSSSSS